MRCGFCSNETRLSMHAQYTISIHSQQNNLAELPLFHTVILNVTFRCYSSPSLSWIEQLNNYKQVKKTIVKYSKLIKFVLSCF